MSSFDASSENQNDLTQLQRIQELELQLLSARDHAIGMAAELGEARHRVEKARKEVSDLRHQIKLIEQSRTWKIGRFMLLPVRILRRLVG